MLSCYGLPFSATAAFGATRALLAIAVAAFVTGLAAGLDPAATLAVFGKAFRESRYVSLVFLVLPVIGVLERYGLQERAPTAAEADVVKDVKPGERQRRNRERFVGPSGQRDWRAERGAAELGARTVLLQAPNNDITTFAGGLEVVP